MFKDTHMHELIATTRTTRGRKNYQLRNDDKIPAIIYGAIKEPQMVSVIRGEFIRTYKDVGESAIITLKLDNGSSVNVLIQDIQTDPLRDEVTHADFRAVDMTKPIEAEVVIHFDGESLAVKNLGGILVHPLAHLKVRALPANLPRELRVNLGLLATFESIVRVSDIAVPEGVEILHEASEPVAAVQAPRSEEEMADLNKAVDIDVTKIEVEKKGKEDEAAEGAEGADKDAKAAPAAKTDKK